MRTNFRTNVLLSATLALVPAAVTAGETASVAPADTAPKIDLSVPLFSKLFSDVPAAQVGDDVITVQDLADSLAMTHTGHEGAAKKKDIGPLLNRLIDARLIILEGRTMGLNDLPEAKKAVEKFRATTLRETLKERSTANVRPDPQQVEALYRPAVQEWKVRSLLFAQEDDAKAFAASAKDAAAFKEAAAAAVSSGKARGNAEGEFIGRQKGLPQVIAAVESMKVGQVSPPVKVGDGHAVILVEDTRFPDVPEARAQAERMAVTPKLAKALRDQFIALTKKHATVDKKLLAAVDYHAKSPGLDALAKDKRVLARIRGEAPVTVADLTLEMRGQYFHGMEQAAKDKKINPKKQQFFESLLFRRLLDKEAKDQHVADEPGFRRAMAEYERSVVFTAFVERVIVPELTVKDDDARAYYDAHQADFKYPDFYKLETLGFARARDAQSACEKLKSGTDVKWLKANAEGQLSPDKQSLQVDGTTVTASSMPEGLATIVSGAGAGDCRIYPQSDTASYAVLVVDKTPSRVQPFEEARGTIDKKVFQQNLARSIEDWAKKLRKAHEVKVFITGIGG